MKKVSNTITIDAPIDEVFKFISKPTKLIEVWPSFIEAKDVVRLPNGGTKFNWKYKMAGMTFEGTSEDIDFINGERVVSKQEGGIDAKVTWQLQEEGGGTKVMLETEYTVPVPLLGNLAENFIVKANDREGATILENFKDRLET